MTATGIDQARNGDSVATRLAGLDERLERMDRVLDGFERRLHALDELGEDMMPMANGMFAIASTKLEALEREGALEFGREALKVVERVATSFSPEDVRQLGDNIVGILDTVRNATQPEVLDVADRAVVALRAADTKPPEKVKLFKALRDPEIRKGMGLMLSVLREMGADHEMDNAKPSATDER